MTRYRYRTAALAGPWRRLREEAEGDAVLAKQARRDDDGKLAWSVPGEIEEDPSPPEDA
jgi:hypothetical protein